MADYYLRSTLNPDKVVKCTVTVTQTLPKSEKGEPVWIVKVGTPESSKSGGAINPAFAHITSLSNLDDVIRVLTQELAAQIDWGIQAEDRRPPYVYSFIPGQDTEGVSLYSHVSISIKDNLPGNGIDKDTITMEVNGFDVTDELRIKGNPFDYNILWNPKIRIESQEGVPS
jgi:hypothetical protein